MATHRFLAVVLGSVLIASCSTTPAKNPASTTQQAAGTDGSAATPQTAGVDKNIRGVPAPDSLFAKLKIGMEMDEVQQTMGHAPDRTDAYESGKRWIPFYFGTDARRLQALYKTEGCLTFTNGNIWGGGGGELILIEVDPSGACFDSDS